MKKQILSPALFLKNLTQIRTLSTLSVNENIQWIKRFDASDKRRKAFQDENGVPAPQAVIFSPTMRCNYNCIGCYSRNHSQDDELSSERIDRFFSELEEVGTSVCFISGGEPFLRKDLTYLMLKHPNLLFIVFTNGSQINEALANKLRESKNIIPALSIDGVETTVKKRRGDLAWNNIKKASEIFKNAGLFFGFSTMVTRETLPEIVDPDFFKNLSKDGYKIGFVMEYIPVGKDVDRSNILVKNSREELRAAILETRKSSSLQIFQLPEDTDDGKNCGAANRFMHITASGNLEPCPFCHQSDISIRHISFKDALQSPLFKCIRNSPEVFKKNELNCSLAENEELVKNMIKDL